MKMLNSWLARVAPSAYIFFSGVVTSAATNLLTAERSTNNAHFSFLGQGDFSAVAVELSRIALLFAIGIFLFWLGYLREIGDKKADAVRGDFTNEQEYNMVVVSIFSERKIAVLAVTAGIVTGIALVVNISLSL